MHHRAPPSVLPLTALLALILGAPSVAEAARVVIAFEEVDRGQRNGTSEVEVGLMEALRSDREWVFVDAQQARKLRQAAGDSALIEADVGDLVRAVTADILVVGQVDIEALDSGPFEGLVVLESYATVKVIAVDSAEVVNAFRVDAMGRHFRARKAKGLALGALSKEIAAKLEPPSDRRMEIEVVLQGSGASEVDNVIGCLERLSSARDVKRRYFGEGRLIAELRTEAEPSVLALELGQQDRKVGCGLEVVGYSARKLELRHLERFSLELVPTPFEGTRVPARWRWLDQSLSAGLATDLGALGLGLDVSPLASPADARRRTPGRLALLGRYRVGEERLHVEAELRAVHNPAVILSTRTTCSLREVEACQRQLFEAVNSGLRAGLEKHRAAIPLQTSLPKAAPARLSIEKIELDGIYPSRLGYYHATVDGRPRNPAGWVVVRNHTDAAAEKVTVEARVAELSAPGLDVAPTSIPGKSTARLPIYLRLDPVKTAKHDENRSVPLDVTLRFEQGAFTFPILARAGVTVFERNALNWAEDAQSVAAFVSPKSAPVVALARAVERALPLGDESHPLATPIALFAALGNLRYRPDPANPYRPEEIDDVLYPAETLASGGGDCDDLAIAYASVLEAAGWPTALVQTTGHVFVSIATDLPPSNRAFFSPDEDRVLVHGGKMWVPVETTQLGRPFHEAWAVAARELEEARAAGMKAKVIPIRQAWGLYPPVDLAPATGTPNDSVEAEPLRRAIQATASALEAERASALERLAKSNEAMDMNRYGVLLVQSGEPGSARKVFERSRTQAESASVLNNLGNLELLETRPTEARGFYTRALKKNESLLEARENLILTLHLLVKSKPSDEDERAFVKHVLALHARSPERVAGLQSRLPQGGRTSSADGVTEIAGLATRITKALEKEGVTVSPALTASRVRASDLSRLVSWVY